MKRAKQWTWLFFIAVIMTTALHPAWGAPPATSDQSTQAVSLGYLENVTFEKLPGRERVTLALSKSSGVTVENQPGNAVLVRLENLYVPEGLRRPLDDESLANVIRVTPVQKSADGRSWVLATIELKRKVPYSVRQEGMNVIIDFNVTSLTSAAGPLNERQTEQEAASTPTTGAVKEVGIEKKVYTGSRIFLDVQGADIKSVFRLLSEQGNVSIVSGEDVKGTVTVSMKGVPWDQALDAILGTNGLSKIEKGNVIMVMSNENFLKHKKIEEELLRREKKQLDTEPLITRVVPIKYRLFKLATTTVDKDGQRKEERGIVFKKDVVLSNIRGEASTGALGSKGSASAEGVASSPEDSMQQNKMGGVFPSETPSKPYEEKKIEDAVFFIQFLHNFLSRDADGNRKGWIAADAETNSIIITAIKSDVDVIVDMIAKTDIPTDQVLIKANIVETTKNTARNLGIQWGGVFGQRVGNQGLYVNPGGTGGSATPPGSVLSGGYTPTSGVGTAGISGQGYGVNFPAAPILGVVPGSLGLMFGTIGGNILDLQLTALQRDGKINILSSPSLVTLDNQTASTENGDEVPFVTPATATSPATITWKKAVLRLEITPHVIDRKNIKMHIHVKKDEADFTRSATNPPILVKETRTDLVVTDGETIVISGLTKQTKQSTTDGLPWLKDIPVLGWLFKGEGKNESMEEVLIFLTPSIIKAQEMAGIQTGF
jgi:type IV pilus secretin PilQ/predicted competence protein